MKLVLARKNDLPIAMQMIHDAKKHLHDCGIDQW